jgi:hypothetical protein
VADTSATDATSDLVNGAGDHIEPDDDAQPTDTSVAVVLENESGGEDAVAADATDQMGPAIHKIDDITRGDDLVRYAVQAQLHHVDRTPEDISGPGSPINRTKLNRCLRGLEPFSPEMLRALDDVIVAVGGRKSHIGGLAPFGMRMREVTEHAGVSVKIPPAWVLDSMNTRSSDELHVLVQASTLLNNFIVAHQVGLPSSVVRDQNSTAIERVAERLILLAGGPPTPRHYEAQLLLGSLARYAFDIVLGQLEASIRRRPLGFRSWRSLTKLMMIARNEERDDRLARRLKQRLITLIDDANDLRDASINPGRSLDLEFFIAVPWGWAGEAGDDDRVNLLLLERAEDAHATLRERGTAAMGYWQRAFAHDQVGHDSHARRRLTHLIRLYDEPGRRPDVGPGLAWVARTLESVMDKNVAVCNVWPDVDEGWYRGVMDAARALERAGLPEPIRAATVELFLHALLQNAGVERRKAIDTLRSGGMVDEVARALARLLDSTRDSWLRVRILFALGFLQARDSGTLADLVDACAQACDAIKAERPTGAQIAELQTALFAIGDVFGVTGIEDADTLQTAGQVRDRLAINLTELVDKGLTAEHGRFTVARALAYLLIFTAQPGRNDLSRTLLERLREHPDVVTRRFCDWALTFRFAKDDTIRPLLYAVQ